MYVYYLEYEKYKREKEEDWQLYLEKRNKLLEAKVKKQKELLARYRASLSVDDRDREFRKIIKELKLRKEKSFQKHGTRKIIEDLDYSLIKKTRQSLIDRGLTDEQIDFIGYCGLSKWQKLNTPIDDGMPGIKVGGKSLLNHSDGIFCPILNFNYQIIGVQIRYNLDKGGKYQWLAGERSRKHRPTSHLQNGELPIGFYYGHTWTPQALIPLPQETTNPVILSEGTSIKPYLISIRTGITTIGASGGSHYNSPPSYSFW